MGILVLNRKKRDEEHLDTYTRSDTSGTADHNYNSCRRGEEV
jgi:hypothetical protein